MRLLGPITRRSAILCSSIASALTGLASRAVEISLSTPFSTATVPAWLTPFEQSQLKTLMLPDGEGCSVDSLRESRYARVRQAIGDSCQIVFIGDGTHGTEEFYTIRSELTETLLEDDQFDAVLCEGDFPAFTVLNRYLGGHIMPSLSQINQSPFKATGKHVGSPEPVHRATDQCSLTQIEEAMRELQCIFPEWMWGNKVTMDFATWLCRYNLSRRRACDKCLPVQLIGIDIYSLYQSADKVLEYLQRTGKKHLAKWAQKKYSILQSFRPEPKDYGKAVFYNVVPSQAENVLRVQKMIEQNENRWEQRNGNTLEYFNAAMNARIVAYSESYFRQLPLTQSNTQSWNIRDLAFLNAIQDTVSFIEDRKREMGLSKTKAKVVVWAHNSHACDAQATEYAGRGIHTVGQLCRQAFGADHVYAIGMTTHSGSVRACSEWGDPSSRIELVPSFEGSHEYLLHLIAKQRKTNSIAFVFRSNAAQGLVDVTARDFFDKDRLQRFVGVCYRPEKELKSHYSSSVVGRAFDAIIHVDHTTALQVEPPFKSENKCTHFDEEMGPSRMMYLGKYGGTYEELSRFSNNEIGV